MMNRGDVYWVDMGQTVGSEIRKQRPCVLVSLPAIHEERRTVIVVPLSTSAKISPPITVLVDCLGKKVAAVCDQIRAIDKSRVKNYADCLSVADLKNLNQHLKAVLALW